MNLLKTYRQQIWAFHIWPLPCDFLLSIVRESSFMSWKVVLWIILDVKPLNRFGRLYHSKATISLIRSIDHITQIYQQSMIAQYFTLS